MKLIKNLLISFIFIFVSSIISSTITMTMDKSMQQELEQHTKATQQNQAAEQYAPSATIPDEDIVESKKPAVSALKNQVKQVIEDYKGDLSETNKRLGENREELDETLKKAEKDISAKTLTVLSIDGGGIRGLMPAKWLEYIEHKSVTNMRIDQLFDYIGGTSIGGILALGVSASTDNTTRLLDTSDLVNFIKHHGGEIFPRRSIATKIRGLFHYQYNVKPLESLLNSHFKDAKLGSTCTNVVVTSVKASDQSRFLFNSRNKEQKDYKLSVVARATSAAPTFFEACYIPEIGEYVVDGGLVANNPTMITCTEAYKYKPVPEGKQFVVSLGTGTLPTSLLQIPDLFKHSIPHRGGAILSAVPVLETVIKAYSEGTERLFERSSLSTNYLRVNPPLSRFIGLDDASESSINYLEELAEKQFGMIDDFFKSDQVQRLLDERGES